jgi:two-component sensor histidine kinase
MSLWDWLINPVGLTPHGFCLLWAPGLIWLHAVSDIVIGVAYFSIPLALGYFAQRRTDLEYRWVILLFVGFILACGLTHFMAVYTLWVAAYGIEGIIKVLTALLSVATAVLLWPLIPKLLALPSPAQMVEEQERTYRLLFASEEAVRRANAELEERVQHRTADLLAANERLTGALVELQDVRKTLEQTVQERTDALKQRDLLLREVYHRVKNNLQVVDSVIVMQMGTLDREADKQFLLALRQRIYALGLVHQQLMGSSDLQTFDLAPFLKELTENMVVGGASGDIELQVDACTLPVSLDFAVPMGLLVTELVHNSLKYGFPNGSGKLSVTVTRDEQLGQVVVSVADDGPGLPGENTSEKPRGTGIGKRLVEGLLRQLRGHMIVDGSRGMSTRLILPEPGVA